MNQQDFEQWVRRQINTLDDNFWRLARSTDMALFEQHDRIAQLERGHGIEIPEHNGREPLLN